MKRLILLAAIVLAVLVATDAEAGMRGLLRKIGIHSGPGIHSGNYAGPQNHAGYYAPTQAHTNQWHHGHGYSAARKPGQSVLR